MGQALPPAPSKLKASCAVLLGLALLSLLVNLGTFSGDSEVHLVFARNLLRGHPLQFNPGVYSSGETSPLYMLLLACVMAIGGQAGAAIFMKLLGVGSALGLTYLLFLETRRGFNDVLAGACAALCVAAAPFFFFQAQLGMENMPFALAAAWLVRSALRGPISLAHFAWLQLAAHGLFYLRPEAVFLALFLYLVHTEVRQHWAALALAATLSLLTLASILWLQSATGVSLQGAGVVRAATSRLGAFHVSGTSLYLSAAPLAILAYAWPLIGVMSQDPGWRSRKLVALLVALVLFPLALYVLCVLPTTHMSRYSLYWWYPLFAVVCRGCRSLESFRAKLIPILALNTLLVGSSEALLRWRAGSFVNTGFRDTLEAARPELPRQVSDALCARVDCARPPVVVALQEVQLRLLLDDRFEVRSLDGIVDSDLARYIDASGRVDHLGYLRDKHVSVVLEFPDYEGRGSAHSLARIYADAADAPVQIECAVFRRVELPGWLYPDALARSEVVGCR
jgi:hypothetical protein